MAIATFAVGYFWGVEVQFRNVTGVISTRVGYSNGTTKDPDYKQVCTGTTGHAEVVEVTFNPDIGSQYSSAVFYHQACHDPQDTKMGHPSRHLC